MIQKATIEGLRGRYEKAFYPYLSKALKNQISSFTSVLKEKGTGAVSNIVFVDTGLANVIMEIYKTVGVASANLTLNDLKRSPKVQKKKTTFGYNDEWTRKVQDYFQVNLFNKVVLPISDTTKEFIQNVITKGIKEGWSIERMVQEIEREDYLDGRVRRILRTETNRAINYGAIIGQRKYEFKTQKKWVAVHDNRTRHWHLAADGQTVEVDGGFSVGGETMDFPGDPNASPGNTINCRCWTSMVAVRDTNGRLIPKEPQVPVRVGGRLRAQLQGILDELTQ